MDFRRGSSLPMISFIESTVFSYSIFYCQAYTTFEEVRRGVWQRYNTDSLSRARDFFSRGRSPWVFFSCICNCLTAVFYSTSTWNIRMLQVLDIGSFSVAARMSEPGGSRECSAVAAFLCLLLDGSRERYAVAAFPCLAQAGAESAGSF